MKEDLHRFGADGRLCGIVHLPATEVRENTSAVIFITAGLIHKTGPFRLHVDLARALAAKSVPSLRFDLSGIGESEACQSGESAEQSAITDVKTAMDALVEKLGVRHFILVGLCSGAEVAHRTALSDARVTGFVAMDGYIARTRAYYFWHYLPRIFSAAKWLDFLRSKWHRVRDRNSATAADTAEDEALAFWEGPGPSRDKLAAEFRALCDRGVRQLQIFSGGSGDYSYPAQFQHAFHDVDFRDLLDVHYLRNADHVYILQSDRQQLIQLISQWITQRFPVELPARPRRDRANSNMPRGNSTVLENFSHTLRAVPLSRRRNSE